MWDLILAGLLSPLGIAVVVVGALVIFAQLTQPVKETVERADEDDDDWWDRQF